MIETEITYKQLSVIVILCYIYMGVIEASSFYHISKTSRDWSGIIQQFLILAFVALLMAMIIPFITNRIKDVFLSLSLLSFAWFLQDISHVLFFWLLSGKLLIWKPIAQIIYLESVTPLPLFYYVSWGLSGLFFKLWRM